MNSSWLIPALIAPGVLLAIRTLWRCRHQLPAAPDNKPGTNTNDLRTCQHILRATQTRRETKP